jgi:uncharacterized protein YciI
MFSAVSEYLAPLAEVDALRADHHAWVRGHYEAGSILVSGRRDPAVGGVIVATAADERAMQELLRDDPFVRGGVARYEVFAFTPADEPLRSRAFRAFREDATEVVR